MDAQSFLEQAKSGEATPVSAEEFVVSAKGATNDDTAEAFVERSKGGFTDESPEGFWANLRNPVELMRNESMPANVIKWLNSDDSDFDKAPDPVSESLSRTLSEMEEVGLQDTEEYKDLAQEFHGVQAVLNSDEAPGFSFDAVKSAFKEDPGQFGAEFINALTADPYLIATPVGWSKAAAAAASITVKAGRATQAVANIAAGAAGSAVTAGAIMTPIVVAEQLANMNEVDGEALMDEVLLTAVSAPMLIGAGKAVSSAAKKALAVDAHIMSIGAPKDLSAAGVRGLAPDKPQSRLGAIAEGAKEYGGGVVNFLGGKAITPIRKQGDVSPSFRRVAQIMEADEVVEGPLPKGADVETPHFERVSKSTGRFVTQLQDALAPLTSSWYGFGEGFIPIVAKVGARATGKRIKPTGKANNDEILKGLRGEPISASVKDTVLKLRTLMDDVHAYATKAGMNIGYIKDYVPRQYMVNVLKERGEDFIRVLSKHGIDASDADIILQRITNGDGFFDLPAGKTKIDPEIHGFIEGSKVTPINTRVRGKKDPNLELGRKLKDIPDSELAPFLSDDLYGTLIQYTEGVVKRAEWIRSFGKDGVKLNNLVKKGITESVQAGKPVDKSTIARTFDLADALQGKYAEINWRPGAATNKFVTSYQLLRTLPLAVLSSLSETFLPIVRGNGTAYLKAIAPTTAHISHEMVRIVNKKFPKAESTRALEELGLGLDGALAERLTTTFGGETTKITNAFFKANLLQDFTKFTRVLANETGKHMVMGHLKELAKGVGGSRGKRYIRELRELGIEPTEGLAWLKRGGSMTDDFYESVKTAGLRFTNDTVMSPRATVRPMWHSNPHFQVLAQLKGYQTVFGNTVMKRIFRELSKSYQGDPEAAAQMAVKFSSAASLMILTAMLGNEIREEFKYGGKGNPRFKGESQAERVLRAIDRTGFTGVLQIALDASIAHRFGSGNVQAAAGPAVSQLSDIWKAATLDLEEKKFNKLKRQAVSAAPVLNSTKSSRDWALDKLN